MKSITFEKTFYGTKILEYGKLVGWVLSSINNTWTFTIGSYKHQTPLDTFEQAKLVAVDYILNNELSNIFKELAANQKSIPPEFQKAIDENFWDLL